MTEYQEIETTENVEHVEAEIIETKSNRSKMPWIVGGLVAGGITIGGAVVAVVKTKGKKFMAERGIAREEKKIEKSLKKQEKYIKILEEADKPVDSEEKES